MVTLMVVGAIIGMLLESGRNVNNIPLFLLLGLIVGCLIGLISWFKSPDLRLLKEDSKSIEK